MTWQASSPRHAAGPKWKPKRCADCNRPHPTYNRDGGKADTPWRCGPCDKLASPLPDADPFGSPKPAPVPRASDPTQGSLL